MSDELNTEIAELPELPFVTFEPVEVDDEGTTSLDFAQDYSSVKVERGDTFLDEQGNVVDPKNVTMFQRLKLAAKNIGQEINDPDPKCKKCYGRGYTGINTDGNIPQPCTCIYKKFYAENPDWKRHSMPSWNRKAKRNYNKQMGKYISLQSKAMSEKYAAEEKSKANLGKNTPDFEARREARLATLREVERLEALKLEATPEPEVETVEAEIVE